MADEKVSARRESVTTTHAAWGAGNPRILATSEHERHVHEIDCDLIHIGSAADSDLQLAATDALHAKILHDPTDEYVLTMVGEGATSGGRHGILRTGAHFTAGPWHLVFVRDEYADHGRPYGGRIGGEAGHQRPQDPRPDYARDHPSSSIVRCAVKPADATGAQPGTADLGRAVLTAAEADGPHSSATSPLTVEVRNDPAAGIYEATAAGTVVGGIPYNVVDEHRVALLAVSVLPEHRGRGVATELVRRALDDVRAQGRTVINYCPVVRTFVADHPGYADLIDTDYTRNAAQGHS